MAEEIAELAKGLLQRSGARRGLSRRRPPSVRSTQRVILSGAKAEARRAQQAARRSGAQPRHHLLAHQARRRPRHQEPRDRRSRGRGDPRQQEPERAAGGAQELSSRQGAHPGRDRHRGARHRRAQHHATSSTTSCPTMPRTTCTASAAPRATARRALRSRWCDGTERDKLRDVERLIRRTLPLEGTLSNEMPASKPTARPARPHGAPPDRTSPPLQSALGRIRRTPASPRRSGRCPLPPRTVGCCSGAARPAAGKPRWNGKRKAAAKAARPVRFGG